jgi:hypothetical protein
MPRHLHLKQRAPSACIENRDGAAAMQPGDAARDGQPPAGGPERVSLDVLEPQARTGERGPVDLDRPAVRVEQTNELNHLIENDAREFLANGLDVVACRKLTSSTPSVADWPNSQLLTGAMAPHDRRSGRTPRGLPS